MNIHLNSQGFDHIANSSIEEKIELMNIHLNSQGFDHIANRRRRKRTSLPLIVNTLSLDTQRVTFQDLKFRISVSSSEQRGLRNARA